MSISVSSPAVVVGSARQQVSLATLFQVTPSTANPAYLVVNGFDRDEYTVSASGATGRFVGATGTLGFSAIGGDERGAGVVFQYQASSGRYVNASLGYLDQLAFSPSSSLGDITDISLFGTSSARLANAYANNAGSLMQADASGYLGTVTIATEPGFTGPVPAQATPYSIAAVAQGFVGQSWNTDGCWVLASTIAAEAGASLPVQSALEIAGQASGEWFVAYDGPAGSTGDWQSMVRTGDVVGFVTGAGGGHITTCVSGAGSSATLVDNITYVDASGRVTNASPDGSADDVVIAAPHAASVEWSGVSSSSVVIYRLDTPIVSESVTSLTLAAGTIESLDAVFSAADPAGRAVTEYQVYNSDPDDTVLVDGVGVAAETAASAATVAALSHVTLGIGTAGGSDVVSVRAYNGLYWGDWQTLSVADVGLAPAPLTSSLTPASTPTTSTAPIAVSATTPVASAGADPVYRFFDTHDGTHFFTASATERDSLVAARPDLTYEGVGLDSIAAPGLDPAAAPVFRFFDMSDGTHFFTASASERDSLIATRTDMSFEGVAFYEDAIQQAGDAAVYRFFDTAHGTHLYTESAAERVSILATRPDLVPEGIAFYAPAAS